MTTQHRPAYLGRLQNYQHLSYTDCQNWSEKLFKSGNAKIAKNTLIWSLPAGITCPGRTGRVVCDGCYARNAESRYPEVMAYRMRRLDLVRKDPELFVQMAIHEINKSRKAFVRIHESGDFFSVEYINCWHRIISACPQVRFYAYTKSERHFPFAIARLASLPNMSLHFSVMPDGLPNYGPIDQINERAERYHFTVCPCFGKNNSVSCIGTCKRCADKNFRPCFVQH